MNPHFSIDQYCRTAKGYSMDMHGICGYKEVERVWLENECIVCWSCVFNNGAPNSFASSSLAIWDEGPCTYDVTAKLTIFDPPPPYVTKDNVRGRPLMIWGRKKNRKWIYFFRGNAFWNFLDFLRPHPQIINGRPLICLRPLNEFFFVNPRNEFFFSFCTMPPDD